MRTFGVTLLEASVANFRVGEKAFPQISFGVYTENVIKLVNSSTSIYQKPQEF